MYNSQLGFKLSQTLCLKPIPIVLIGHLANDAVICLLAIIASTLHDTDPTNIKIILQLHICTVSISPRFVLHNTVGTYYTVLGIYLLMY